jgi:hypothetical protein
MTKRELKKMVAQAYEMKAATHETEVVFYIYSGCCYILDTEDDDVISIEISEQDAIDTINGINDDTGYKTGCYYKPVLIDADSGERVTRKNFQYYDIKSEWVQNHIREMEQITF